MRQHMFVLSIDGMLRDLWATLCQLIYRLIAWLFELFISIAQVDFLSQDSIKEVYKRITMIFTIIMVFYITFELVKYVVQPDAMTDKEKGAGNIAKKIIIVIVLIAFTPEVFSLAYKAQNVLLKNQIISKIVLGKQNIEMSTYGRSFAANMLGIFYYVDDNIWEGDEECDGIKCKTVVNINLASLNERGTLEFLHHGLNEEEKIKLDGETEEMKRYKITFDGLLAVFVGSLIVYVLVLYCIDAGTRVGQLAFLQIIAPIPIIGYLSPQKDGIFQKWLKQCLATYLDLFIRLVVIYFVLLLCDILGQAYHNGTLFNNLTAQSQTSKTFMYIFIVMGLLLLGQRIPKMLKELFPSSTAASGNLGLKAGERVAPMAAKVIGFGAGLASNIVRGGIRRAAWRRARNEANGWVTGWRRFTREGREQNRQRREQERQNRLEARNARQRNRSYQRDKQKKDAYDKAKEKYDTLRDRETSKLKEDMKAALKRGDTDEAKRIAAQLKDKNKELMQSKEYKDYINKSRDLLGQTQTAASREKAVNAAKERVKNAEAELIMAHMSGDRERITRAEDALTKAEQDLKVAQNPTQAAKDKVSAAQSKLDEAKATGDATKIAEAEAALTAAKQEYNKTSPITAAYEEVTAAKKELEAANAAGDPAQISAAEAKLAKAQENFESVKDNNMIGGGSLQSANRQIVSNAAQEVARAKEALRLERQNGSPENIAVAERRLAQANQNLEAARKQSSESIKELLQGDSKELAQQYQQAQQRTSEQVIEDKNKSYQGMAGSVLSTLGSGIRGAVTGAHATKLEEIGKQVSKANKDDIANVKAVQKYYDDGGTGWVDRTVQQVEKNLGMPTAYERTQLGIHSDEPKIKTLEAQAALTKDVKSTADAAEDRLKDKIEDLNMVVDANESISIGPGDRVPKRDVDGNIVLDSDGNIEWEKDDKGNDKIVNSSVQGGSGQTIAQMYRGVKARASQAKSEAEEAAKRKADLEHQAKQNAEEYKQASEEARQAKSKAEEAAKRKTDLEREGKQNTEEYKQVSNEASQAESEAKEAEKRKENLERQGKQNAEEYKQVSAKASYLNTVAANAEYAVTQFQKNGARYEYSKILDEFAHSANKEETLMKLQTGDNKEKYDGVAVEKVYSALRSLDVARTNPKIVADMRTKLSTQDFETFMSGNITDFRVLDRIKVAAINAGNAYERDVKDIKEKQRSTQTSNKTSAQKAANDFNGGNSGK